MLQLRHFREPVNGQPVENTFEAVDDYSGEQLGACVIYADDNPALFPARPYHVRLELEGDPIPDALLGAAVARGRELCVASGKYCRLYTRCHPYDDALLASLEDMGFRDNDGLVRMRKSLPSEFDFRLPPGCTELRDDLSDPTEQRYFLERYNDLYNSQHDMAWLARFMRRDDFTRIQLVSSTDLAGEILIWREDEVGVIGYIQTSRRWRRLGVATCLLGLASRCFERLGLENAEASVRVRIPHILKTMENVGFRQIDLLMRYPGLDVDAGETRG